LGIILLALCLLVRFGIVAVEFKSFAGFSFITRAEARAVALPIVVAAIEPVFNDILRTTCEHTGGRMKFGKRMNGRDECERES